MSDHTYPTWLLMLFGFGAVLVLVCFMSFVAAVIFLDVGAAAMAALGVSSGLVCVWFSVVKASDSGGEHDL
jgi:hypothetical protein